MLLPRLLRPAPASGVLPIAALPGRSALTVISTDRSSFIGEVLARFITDDGRWDRCAWVREPPTEPSAAARAMVDAIELRISPECSQRGEPPRTVVGALDVLGPGSVLVLELNHRCDRRFGSLVAEIARLAGDVSAEIIVTYGRRPTPGAQRALGAGVRIDLGEFAHREFEAVPLDAAVIARVRHLTRGCDAALHDLAGAPVPAEPIESAAREARTGRGFLDRVTDGLLETRGEAEREALHEALRTNYWHPRLSARSVSTDALRPWVVPLEHDWSWVRPLWRPALAKRLDRPRRRRPTRRAARASAMLESVAAPAVEVDWRPAIEFRLLGEFEVRLDGRPTSGLSGRLAISLLRYLLTRTDRSSPRDVLIDVFWPDADPDRARNRLQVAVSSLRRALRTVTDVEIVEFVDGSYRINRGLDLTIDLAEFERFAALAARSDVIGDSGATIAADQQAVRLYRGDLCPDLPYEEWTVYPRERTRLMLGDVLDRLARNQWRAGDFSGCVATSERMLDHDPCREDAHRLLMRCQAATGHPHQAMRQYDACRRVLKAILGVEPSQATYATYREIRDRAAAGHL